MRDNKTILFIHPRRGLYSITRCNECGHIFSCNNCDASLVTYRAWEKNLELVCHQCQTYYSYPHSCPICLSHDIVSRLGGIDNLTELITDQSQQKVYRFDKQSKNDTFDPFIYKFAATTRIFDPSIPYSDFAKIILVGSENLMASPDYLVSEETNSQLAQLINALKPDTEIVFDTNSSELSFFGNVIKLNSDYPENEDILKWYFGFLDKESKNRQLFGFPPFKNLILLTIQQKNKDKASTLIDSARNELNSIVRKEYVDVSVSSVYPARFLRRKGMYSYHILMKYPRQYAHFNQLRDSVMEIADRYAMQVRLNPRHLF